ncbi:MAG TPA: hypothetical protein VHO24_10075 [Opitutaceae bacterium]|nr:hypothetical protein [Opitutaceae bacterium]
MKLVSSRRFAAGVFLALCCSATVPAQTVPQPGAWPKDTAARETGREHNPDEEAVFFPPFAPIFGAGLNDTPRTITYNSKSYDPPEGLGHYVGEFFYPALSTRLFAGQLDRKLAVQLAAYLGNRTQLVNELQNALVTFQGEDSITRERELRAFAALQAPRLAAHEAEAEQLRQKLIQNGLLHHTVDWSKDRLWKIGDPQISRFIVPKAEFQVVRATAYYQKGLLPEQRGLLCEMIAKEPLVRPTSWNSQRGKTAWEPAMFFSPETSRFAFPSEPAALAAKLFSYAQAKEALKDELWAAAVEHDRSSETVRTKAFEKLAEEQWPRLARLADLAEEIRRDVAVLPPPPAPPLPPQLPPSVALRIEACRNEKAGLESERAERIRATTRAFPAAFTSTGPKDPGEMMQAARDRMLARQKAINEAEAEFRRENADRYATLEENLKTLSADLNEFARVHQDPATGQPMNVKSLVARINASDRHFSAVAREEVLYKNYRIAMLEPGLSPEQRRLLFVAARVALAQPLPTGERFPSGRYPR